MNMQVQFEVTKDRPVLSSEELAGTHGALSGRLFVVRPGDRRLGAVWDERGGSEWNDTRALGPAWFVVVGSETTDDDCRALAYRYGLDASGLIAYRDDSRLGAVEVHHWGPLQ